MSADETREAQVQVRPMTVGHLRERLADLPDTAAVYVETIVGGDLVTSDTALADLRLLTDGDGYHLRLLPDPSDNFDTRGLIDHGLAARDVVGEILDDHGDCFDGKHIHTWDGDECADDCAGCCAEDVIKRLRDLHYLPAQAPSGGDA